MALQKRERILAFITGGLVLILPAVLLISGGGGSLKPLVAKRDALDKEVDEKKRKERSGERAEKMVLDWEKRSLPTNLEKARAGYTNWLSELVVKTVGFEDAKITPLAGRSNRGIYTPLPFRINGKGTLTQLTRFLFEFYSTPHLHKVGGLTINPIEDSEEFTLEISVEALMLPGADREDELSTAESNRLAKSKLEEYRQAIVRRRMEDGVDGKDDRFVESGGLFAAYEPPPRPPRPREYIRPEDPPPPKPSFDFVNHSYLTGIVETDGHPEAWIQVRPWEQVDQPGWKAAGEGFSIGPTRVTIVRIGRNQIEIELDGRRRLIAFEESLRQGVELPELPELPE